MKFMKWKILAVTCGVCLLPIIAGVALWSKLPSIMAIHFNIQNQPDGFASRGFVVFGIPLLMVALQAFCCFVNDINAYKHGERRKFERATKWIIPILTLVLQAATLAYGLGRVFDVRRVAALLVGCIFLVIGNYLPKFDYIKNYDLDAEKARKINRFMGFETVCMGVLFLLSIFLPPIATVVCLFLLIPYALISIIYGVRTGRS